MAGLFLPAVELELRLDSVPASQLAAHLGEGIVSTLVVRLQSKAGLVISEVTTTLRSRGWVSVCPRSTVSRDCGKCGQCP